MSHWNGIGFVVLVLILNGCTRPSSERANVTVSFPMAASSQRAISKSGDPILQRVIIRVSGPGMSSPYNLKWDTHVPNNDCKQNNCVLNLDSGNNRLFQVLAIYAEGNHDHSIYYKDRVQSLVAGSNQINDLQLEPVYTPSMAVTETQITGRYLSKPDGGPTGLVEIRYVPPGPDRLPMLITETEMFNGWFSVFGLEGIPFDFVINGQSITNGPVDIANLESKFPLNAGLLKMIWPTSYYKDESNFVKQKNPMKEFVGFFGPGRTLNSTSISNEKICYGKTTGLITRLFKDAVQTPLSYNVNNTSDPTQVFVAGGGVMDPAQCTSGYNQGLAFAYDPVQQMEPIQMDGPFVRLSSGELLKVQNNVASWDFLPGANLDLEALKLYVMDSATMKEFERPMSRNEIDCLRLDESTRINNGRVLFAGAVPATEKSFTLPATIASTFLSPGAILCPIRKGGIPMNSVARTWGGGSGSSGGGGGVTPGAGSGPYLRFEIMSNGSLNDKYQLSRTQCYPTQLRLYQNGQNYSNNSGTSYEVLGVKTLNSNIGIFYGEATCNTLLSSNPTIPNGSNQVEVWFKPTTAGLDQQFSGVTVTNSNPAATAIQFEPTYNKFDVGNDRLDMRVSPKLVLNECLPVPISLVRFSGERIMSPPAGVTINLGSGVGWSLWNNPSCFSGASTITMAPGNYSAIAYIKLTQAAPSGMLLNGALSAVGYDFNPPTVATSIGGSSVDAIELSFDEPSLIRNHCLSGQVRLVNFDGGEVRAKNPLTVQLSLPQGTGVFFQNGNCDSNAIDSVTFGVGESSRPFFVKFYNVGTAITLNAQGAGLRLYNSDPASPSGRALTVSEDMDPWYLRISPPNFSNAEIVGSHEFNDDAGNPFTYKKIPFYVGGMGGVNGTSSAGSVTVSIQCGYNGTFSDCTASEVQNIAGQYYYLWHASDAAMNTTKQLRVIYSGPSSYGDRWVQISPSALYGPRFKVLNCNGTAGAGAGQTIQAIAHRTDTILCLPNNTTYARSTTDTIKTLVLGESAYVKHVIGHSDGTSRLDASGLVEPLVSFPTNLNQSVTFANVSMIGLSSNSLKAIEVSNVVSTSPSTILHLNNLKIGELTNAMTGNSSTGILIAGVNDLDLSLELKGIQIRIADAAAHPIIDAIKIQNSSYITIKNSQIFSLSNQSTGIRIESFITPMNSISIENSLIEAIGNGVLVTGAPGFPITNLKIQNTKIWHKESLINPSLPNIMALGLIDALTSGILISDNIFIASPSVPNSGLLQLLATTDGTVPLIQEMNRNVFSQGYTSSPALKADHSSQTSSQIMISDFQDNSLAYNNTVVNTAPAIENLGIRPLSIRMTGATFASAANNRLCSLATQNWAGTGGWSGTMDTNLTSFTTLQPNSLHNSTGRCTSTPNP